MYYIIMKRDISYVYEKDFYSQSDKEDELQDKNNKDNDSKDKKKKETSDNISESPGIKTQGNHVYYYASVTKKSCLELVVELKKIEKDLLKKYKDHKNHQEYIYLHINSNGGSVFAAFGVIDTIKNIKIPIISIIEGAAASAATLISVVCDYRIIYPTSYMLIHQLSSMYWGKMTEMEEEITNLKKLMDQIKNIYKKYTKIKEEDLEEILKHDYWWDSKYCLEVGLVDEIRQNNKEYKIKNNMIEL